MPLATTSEAADRRRRTVDVHGQPYVLREYIGTMPLRGRYVDGNEANDDRQPQGFLVDQPPNAVTPPHFHETDQFQVFVAGSGRMGKQAAEPLAVHFAGGHTPYGPVVAGEEGICYFTLRRQWDPGAKYMPAMRERLVRGRQRHRLAAGIALDGRDALRARTAVAEEAFLPPEDDGLLGALLRLGPHASAASPDPREGGGQYHVVVDGALRHAGETFDLWSCQYAFAHEPPVMLEAGPDGLEILVLRFPRGS